MDDKVKKEYERLSALFKDVEESKTKLVNELLLKAAFLKVQLDGLELQIKKYGAVQMKNGEFRESVSYKTFLSSLAVYQTIIKTLNSIMGKNTIDEDDEFDEFMKKLGG